MLTLLFPLSAFGADMYGSERVDPWHYHVRVKTDITLKSKYTVYKKDVKQFRREYNRTMRRFEEFTGKNPETCAIGKLEIRIIGVRDLSNRTYFPHEGIYSDSDGPVVGRYFRKTNTLYLVPKSHHYNWNKSVSHELMHHLLDECGMSPGNAAHEHRIINAFEIKYFGGVL